MEDKIPMVLAVAKVDTEAQIDIVGEIGWTEGTTFKEFRRQVLDAKEKGAITARLYISSPGGSCFHANEIANLLTENFDTITGVGGAIVASAASYLAVKCTTFSQPKNGVFMIHPPVGWTDGKAEDMEAYAKLLKDLEADYRLSYKAKAKSSEKIDEILDKRSDCWLTADEALELGLIDTVRESVKIDNQTKAMAMACASLPADTFPFDTPKNTNSKQNNMNELQELVAAVGMPAEAKATDVVAAAVAIIKERDEVKAQLKEEQDKFATAMAKLAEVEAKEAAQQAEAASKLIDEAIKDGRLNEKEDGSVRAFWQGAFENDYNAAQAALGALTPPKSQGVIPEDTAKATGGAMEERREEIRKKNSENK